MKYTARNKLLVGTHYLTAVSGLAVSAFLAQPWMIAVGALAASVLHLKIAPQSLKKIVADLKRQPEEHRDSKHLGVIVSALTNKLGMKLNHIEVLSTKTDSQKAGHNNQYFPEKVPNAAAASFGKSVVFISDEMLALLDSDEEHAVLAHEFAHIGYKHSYLAGVHNVFVHTAKISNFTLRAATVLSIGVAEVCSVIGASYLVKQWGILSSDRKNLLSADDAELSAVELSKKKKTEKSLNTLQGLTGVLGFNLFNPAYASLWLSTKAIGVALELSAKGLSRRCEYQADKGAVELGASALALITSLRKLEALKERSLKDAFNDEADIKSMRVVIDKGNSISQFWRNINSTHPTVEDRVMRLSHIARKNGFKPEDIDLALNSVPDISHVPNIPIEVIRRSIG